MLDLIQHSKIKTLVIKNNTGRRYDELKSKGATAYKEFRLTARSVEAILQGA